MIALLCMSRKRDAIHPEMLAMIAFLCRLFTGALVQEPFNGFYMPPSNTIRNGKFGMTRMSHTNADFLIKKCEECVYLFHIHHKESSTPLIDQLDEMWKETTSTMTRTKSSNHYLLLIRKRDSAIIIQSFFGHYTFKQWCAFDQPLMQIKTPPVEDENFFCPIDPNPRFRGILDLPKLNEFFYALHILTLSGVDHSKHYAHITGISLSSEMLSDSYKILYTRLDLRRIIY